MRSYALITDERGKAIYRGLYEVPQFGAPKVYRRTRTSAGMSYTLKRREMMRPAYGLEHSHELLRLVVHGTTDALASGLTFFKKRAPCPCCGANSAGKFQLNEAGKRRLENLRRRRAQRAMVM